MIRCIHVQIEGFGLGWITDTSQASLFDQDALVSFQVLQGDSGSPNNSS